MAYCPNCGTPVSSDAPRCNTCGALFGTADGWRPVDTVPKEIQSPSVDTSVDMSARLAVGLLRWSVYGVLSLIGGCGAFFAAGSVWKLGWWPDGLAAHPFHVFALGFLITWVYVAWYWNTH
jgi:hypothetical protein